jgi:urease accessory protein
VPLQTFRPFYYDRHEPTMAIVYILNPTGGTLQGDRLRVDVRLEAGSKVHLTTQAATKIYRMNSDYATQTINIDLGRDSYMEYLPDQTIPYRSSRFYQEVTVKMRDNSSLVHWEMLSAGRKGREHFDFDIFYSKLNVEDRRGICLLSDTTVLEPSVSRMTRDGIMGRNDLLGNFYVVSDKVSEKLVDRIQSTTHGRSVMMGVSPTSLTKGLVARVLGTSARVVRDTLEKIWNETRLDILGSPAMKVRK